MGIKLNFMLFVRHAGFSLVVAWSVGIEVFSKIQPVAIMRRQMSGRQHFFTTGWKFNGRYSD
jgi:hypothetical protein